jgi:hypothetical protein
MANLRKVGDGKYRVDWRDQKGNRYRKTFERKKDADDHLAAIKVDMKAGTYVAPKVVPTLREVTTQWFANKVAMKLRPATLSSYRTRPCSTSTRTSSQASRRARSNGWPSRSWGEFFPYGHLLDTFT